MLYCVECKKLFEEPLTACEDCGKDLRPPRGNDPVLLASAGLFQANMIEPLLMDTKTPYARMGNLGVGFTMSAGALLETYRFYVPYDVYVAARELLETTFGEDPIIMEGLC